MLKKRLFGVMVVLVVLMLAICFAACSGGGDSDGTSGGGGGGKGDIPANYTNGWPSANILAKYGLSGLPKWSGAGNSWYGTEKEDGEEVIAIIFEASSDPTSFYRSWFTSNGFEEYSYGGTVSFINDKTGAAGTVYYNKSEGMGHVGGGIAL